MVAILKKGRKGDVLLSVTVTDIWDSFPSDGQRVNNYLESTQSSLT